MGSRSTNEAKFAGWEELPDGGRRYHLEVRGSRGWSARYLKEVDAQEVTRRFWQEIYDEHQQLVEIHEKYPINLGHRSARKQ